MKNKINGNHAFVILCGILIFVIGSNSLNKPINGSTASILVVLLFLAALLFIASD